MNDVTGSSAEIAPAVPAPVGVSAAPAAAPDPATLPVVRTTGLTRNYQVGSSVVHALRGVDLQVMPGEMVAIMGPSGSGKSTLLNVLGCLDRPTGGRYWLQGYLVSELTRSQLALVRNRRIGFVFQTFNLLPRATALANVMLPMTYAGVPGDVRRRRATQALAAVGLAERAAHKPAELSGGQQRRVAIARSLVNGPSLILADEPTGNLDTRTGMEVMAILQELHRAGITILLVTHEADIAAYCTRSVTFQDGRVVADEQVLTPRSASDELAKLPNVEVSGERDGVRA